MRRDIKQLINYKNKAPFFVIILKSLVLLAVVVISAHADKTEAGLYFDQSIGASWNPLGVLLDSKLLYALPLIDKSGFLWESTKLEAGLQNEWTPADNVLSARLTVEPIAFFDVVCKAGLYGMYNNLGYGCYRLASPKDPYGPAAQKTLVPGDANGYWVSVAPTLKAKLGRFIVLNTTTINCVSIDGDGYFLEIRSYLVHRTKDVDVVDNFCVLAQCTQWLLAGATYRYADVMGAQAQSQRLCAMAIVKPAASKFKGAFAAVQAGPYPADPLFLHSFFFGCLVGTEFRLGGPCSGKEEKE
jgi:hypothetical protein